LVSVAKGGLDLGAVADEGEKKRTKRNRRAIERSH